MHKIKSVWSDKMAFDHHIVNHVVRTDSIPPLGDDSGASPKRLMLASLAGCSGIDVASLLNKMRIQFTSFEIDVEADLTDEHPKVYSEVRMVYRISGKNLKRDKIERAVELSQHKYCGVSAMIRKNCPLEYTIELTEE